MGVISGLSDSSASQRPRLSEVLFPNAKPTFESFAKLPSNAQALELTRVFAANGASFVALIGPSGCGKSHLLKSASSTIEADRTQHAEVLDAALWALNPPKLDHAALILDNVEDALDKPRVRLQLRLALERRVRSGRPALLSFTAQRPSRSIRAFLPSSKDWIVCGIQEPDARERECLVRQLAEAEGLKLCDCLVWLLSHRMNGNGRSLLGALKRLRLDRTQWTEPDMILRACGVLDPFFTDNASWDLRDQIACCSEEFAGKVTGSRQELAIYTMLRVALLAEEDVARYYEMEPGEAYSAAIRFEDQVSVQRQAFVASEVPEFLQFVVQKLKCP